VQTTAVPAQVPLVQTSFVVQASPSSQFVPSLALDQALALLAGLQTWQGLAGFAALLV